MTNVLEAKEFQARLQRLDALVQGAERLADPAARSHVREVVRALLDLHGAGLTRLVGHLEAAALEACANDEVVAGLLLHGLHPLDLETRVRQALDDVRPYLQSHGGDVEVLQASDHGVRLRLRGNCHGCPSSAATMKQTIEEAILARAPDAVSVEVEGVVDGPPTASDGGMRVALPVL
jgi:Fe-S cluster biogenesis protein NfuA